MPRVSQEGSTFSICLRNKHSLSSIQKNVTFQSVKDDISYLSLQGDIEREKLQNDLVDVVIRMEEIVGGDPEKHGEFERLFKTFERQLKNNTGRNLSEIGYQILLQDIEELKLQYL